MIAGINTLVDLQEAIIQQVDLPLLVNRKISVDVLRIDKIHATISGNKWFKLKYALQEAIELQKNTIVTFGGAFSNHLVATAYACSRLGLQSIGIIRGEEAAILSSALADCRELGMQFHFISRDAYRDKATAADEIDEQYPGAYLIPEGGSSHLGIKGAGEILDLDAGNDHSHICCALGTGTMMAGLINKARPDQQVIGISALKVPDGDNSIKEFIEDSTGQKKNYSLQYNYHFGGYAKRTPQLIAFMNDFYTQTGIPLDIVYTAKLMYAITDMGKKGHFPAGSRLLIIHSGGLQGNRSLPKNTLVF